MEKPDPLKELNRSGKDLERLLAKSRKELEEVQRRARQSELIQIGHEKKVIRGNSDNVNLALAGMGSSVKKLEQMGFTKRGALAIAMKLHGVEISDDFLPPTSPPTLRVV